MRPGWQQIWRRRMSPCRMAKLFFFTGPAGGGGVPSFASVRGCGEADPQAFQINIQNDDPMAVYKSANEIDMFMGITFNNIRVSFLAFVMGILASLGTGLILMQNGIMIGSFFELFFREGVLMDSLLVVFIHGTLELSAIVVAGAAGITMGSGLLYPGTYSRMHSFKRSAKEGLKMTTGLIPIFIAAGFLESFVTRHTDMPVLLSLFIIGGSLAFVIWYFVYYPSTLHTKNLQHYGTNE